MSIQQVEPVLELPAWMRPRASVNLNEEQIEEVLDRLDALPIIGVGERRRDARVPWRYPRLVLEIGEGPEATTDIVTAVTRNISKGGMSFLFHHTLFPRQHLAVIIPTPNRPSWPLKARVIRCRPVDPQIFEIGARFFGTRRGDQILNMQ
jgi:hypothetical protein